jgi:hypothetical protein
MEPRREVKVPTPASEKKLKRFRIVKLEERIAPGAGNTHRCNTNVVCLTSSGGSGQGSIE